MAKSPKKLKKLPKKLRNALKEGNVLPSSVADTKLPKASRKEIMQAAKAMGFLGKPAKPQEIAGEPAYRPGIIQRERAAASLHSAIDKMMADALVFHRQEAAIARRQREKEYRESQPKWHGEVPVRESIPLASLGAGSAMGNRGA